MDGITREEERDLILSVGTHASERRLSPVEAATLMQRLLDGGASRKDVAQRVQLRDATMVGRFLRLLRLPEEVSHLVDWKGGEAGLSLTQASEIARLRSAATQRELGELTLRHGLTANEVREAVQRLQRGNEGVAEAVASIAAMRPTIVRRHIFIGAVTRSSLRERLRTLAQHDRDFLFEQVLRHIGVPRADGRLGTTRFTVAGGDEIRERLTELDWEAVIQDSIEGALLEAT